MFKKESRSELAQKVVVNGHTATSKPRRRFNLRFSKIATLIVFVSVVILFLGVYYLASVVLQRRNLEKNGTAVVDVCNSLIIREGIKALRSQDPSQLKKITDNIQKLTNYDTDPNCLYFVATYYADISDYDNSKAHLDKLQSTLKGGKIMAGNLSVEASVDNLQAQVDFIKQQDEEIGKNMLISR